MSDRTWTLFVRLWKRVGRAAHEKREWSDDHLRELITRHPLPWHTDQDWTWEVIDARNATVKSGFMSSNAAQQYVEKAHEVALTDPRQIIREYVQVAEACHEPPYDGDRNALAYKYNALLRIAKELTDDQLRTLYARYCECRPLNTARCRHSHDCYCDILTDVTIALHGVRQELYGGELCDAEAVTTKDRSAARCRLTTAWSDYVAECEHLGKEP